MIELPYSTTSRLVSTNSRKYKLDWISFYRVIGVPDLREQHTVATSGRKLFNVVVGIVN